ncbi:hypothetical protein ACJD0Z_15140 [Flavobacteriaceae bacterium M23B6Z8]
MRIRDLKSIIMLSSWLLAACQNYESPGKLFYEIEEIVNSYSDEKIIDLKKVYEFQWDTLYIFREFMHTDSINEIIGMHCNCDDVPDSLVLYIFIYQGEVVKKIIIEPTKYGFSNIEYLDFERSIKIHSKESKFKIFRSGNDNYLLEPLGKVSN